MGNGDEAAKSKKRTKIFSGSPTVILAANRKVLGKRVGNQLLADTQRNELNCKWWQAGEDRLTGFRNECTMRKMYTGGIVIGKNGGMGSGVKEEPHRKHGCSVGCVHNVGPACRQGDHTGGEARPQKRKSGVGGINKGLQSSSSRSRSDKAHKGTYTQKEKQESGVGGTRG